jgi:hypothetical protein
MGTITATYLEYNIGCENREITAANNSVPTKINSDNHRADLYSENDFVKLKIMVTTIRTYIRIVIVLEYPLAQNCSENGIVKHDRIPGKLTAGAQNAPWTLFI